MFADDLFCGQLVLLPTGRSFDERHFRAHAGFNVPQHRFTDREIDRDVMTAQFIGQIANILAGEHSTNFVAGFACFSSDQLAHRSISD
jgi:hypothetical protein